SALHEIIATKFDLGILLDDKGFRIKKQNYHIEIENDELIVKDADGEIFHYTPGQPESQRIQETLFREKRNIIENSLFGVDINPNSVHICCLRLWIELLKNAYYTKESGYTELETLPNIDINIKCGNSLLHRFCIAESISTILSKTGISISEYRQEVASYKNAHTKEDKYAVNELINRIKSTLRHEIYIQDPLLKSLQSARGELQKLQDPELFDSDRVSKPNKETEKKIRKLKEKITKKERELEEIKSNRMYLGAFEWRIEFPEVLDDEGNFLGFDCIIGNPPYIQLQSLGKDSATLERMGYETYERTGDIYCLFYELGLQLLRTDGLLSFITSNKWMRAGYGASLRRFLAEQTNPIQLIDFAGTRIFDSATVDVNILSLLKQPNTGHTASCAVDKSQIRLDKLSDYFRANMTIT
ncbi:MAG: Eco57I restriction-modification methylase domain-containing protein, partial [Rikenella sp.]|nr:Eco57I restriction-modification methylase domain-containing protein [Rikenella sp.]